MGIVGSSFATSQPKVHPQKKAEVSLLSNTTSNTRSNSKSVEAMSSVDQYSIMATEAELYYFRALDVANTYNDFQPLISIVADDHAEMLRRGNAAGALGGYAMLNLANQVAMVDGGVIPALVSLLQRNNFPSNLNAVKTLHELLKSPVNHELILMSGAMQQLLLLLHCGGGVSQVLNEAVLGIISLFATTQSIPLVSALMTLLHERRVTAISAAIAITHIACMDGYEARLTNAGAIDLLIMYVKTAKDGDHMESFLTCLNVFDAPSSRQLMVEGGIVAIALQCINTNTCMPAALILLLNISIKCGNTVKTTIVLTGGIAALLRLFDERLHMSYMYMCLATLTDCSAGVEAALPRFPALFLELRNEVDDVALDSLLRSLINIIKRVPDAAATSPYLDSFAGLLKSPCEAVQLSCLSLLLLIVKPFSAQVLLERLREGRVMEELLRVLQTSTNSDVAAACLAVIQPLQNQATIDALEVLDVPHVLSITRRSHPALHEVIDAFIHAIEPRTDVEIKHIN